MFEATQAARKSYRVRRRSRSRCGMMRRSRSSMMRRRRRPREED